MDTLSLQRLILNADLPPAEKLVGMALAFHLNKKEKMIRVRQETIAAETGYSVSTVKRALHSLIAAGVFESKRTGRATILLPKASQASGKNSGIVEVPRVTHLIAHPRPIRERKTMPWDYETDHSSLAEEKAKRVEIQFALERVGKSG